MNHREVFYENNTDLYLVMKPEIFHPYRWPDFFKFEGMVLQMSQLVDILSIIIALVSDCNA